MATLKEHQAAMVDLLANGSGIPASASRLAHAMHDVLSAILSEPDLITKAIVESKAIRRAIAETTPGLNDKALSQREKALKTDIRAEWPKAERFNVNIKLSDMDEVKTTLHNMQSHLDGARDSQRAAENRVKELENTIRQLKANNAKLKGQLALVREQRDDELRRNMEHEQAGCRREDTQVCAIMPGKTQDVNYIVNTAGCTRQIYQKAK
jgi:small-conductance mechanosensitive channel